MTRQPDSRGLDLLRSQVRRQLFEHLSDLPLESGEGGGVSPRRRGLSAQELADVVGLHLTTVRFHVDQLVAAGLLATHQERASGAGRPRKLYVVPTARLSAPESPEALEAFATLSDIVGQAAGSPAAPLEQTASTLEATGREWAVEHMDRLSSRSQQRTPATTPGDWLGKVGAVLDLLVGWGHSPDVRTTSGAREVDIVLRDCPFLALAKDQPQMVCGVHRGLLRGALDALGEESAVLDLQPLADPRTCRAHLRVTTPFSDRGEAR